MLIPSSSAVRLGSKDPPRLNGCYEGRVMSPRILIVSPSAEVSEIAREMAPGGFETVIVSDSEVVASLPNTEYMVCYPHVPMRDAFYQAVPKLRLVQLLSAGYDNVDL